MQEYKGHIGHMGGIFILFKGIFGTLAKYTISITEVNVTMAVIWCTFAF